MEEPIQVVIETAPLWERVLVLLMPLVGGALAVIGGMLFERYRVKRSQRREHLRDIQVKVFVGDRVKCFE